MFRVGLILLLAGMTLGPVASAFGELIGWYPFDEGAGDVVGDVVAGYDAPTGGDPTWVTGQRNGAMQFDGDDWAQGPASAYDLQLVGGYTWVLWVKADATQKPWATFFNKAGVAPNPPTHWQLTFKQNYWRTIIVEHAGEVWQTGIILADIAGAWHHIAITYNGTTITSYLDGNPASAGTLSTLPGVGNETLNIAMPRNISSSYGYTGMIDDLAFYDEVLSEGDIQDIMVNGPQLPPWTLRPLFSAFTMLEGGDAPGPVVYTLSNNEGVSHTFDIAEVDKNGDLFDYTEQSGDGDHVFNTALEGRWGIWEAESRKLSPQDVIRMHREYGVGIFFYREATGSELQRYRSLGIMNIAVAHALYSPWNDHDFLKDIDAVRAWVSSAVAPEEVHGLAYDCESTIERCFALSVIQAMADEVEDAGKLFITCPHFNINDPRFNLGPADYNEYSDIVMPWCYNLYGQPTYKEGISELVREWREVIPDRTVYPMIDCEKNRSASEAADVIPYIANGTDEVAPVNGCTLFYPYASWSKIHCDNEVQRFYQNMRDYYGLKTYIPCDYSWLSLSTAQLTVPASSEDPVSAVIDPSSLAPGVYTAYVKFSDDSSPVREKTAAIELTVIARLPVAVIDANPTCGLVPLTVDFDASGSYDPDGTVVGYAWDFETDGTADSNDMITSHVYQSKGEYLATLTVTDNDGLTRSSSVPITVEGYPGDFDDDRDVDQEDFGRFQACLTGPGVPQDDPHCTAARLDGDGDVDGNDCLIFYDCVSGPGVPSDPYCRER